MFPDFTCPYCEHEWDNDGDPIGDETIDEDCPNCKKPLKITASWSVHYDVEKTDG